MVDGNAPMHPSERPRPLSVVVLAIWLALGMVWAILFDSSLQLGDIGLIVVTGLLTYGVWEGRSWAFVLLFGSTVLCLIMLAIYGRHDPVVLIPSAILIVGLLVLLLHPSTRRFALDDGTNVPRPASVPAPMNGRKLVGMRRNTVIALAMLLAAITIAGVLGVMRAWQLGT